MFFKILHLVQFVLSLILEAEGQFPLGAGTDKKTSVMKSLSAEVRRQGLVPTGDEKAAIAFETTASSLVDDLVGVLNSTGAFGARAHHFAAREPSEDFEPPPSE